MNTVNPGKLGGKMTGESKNIVETIAHHDAAIGALGHRMQGVENGMKTLQGEVHTGFNQISSSLGSLNSKIDKIDARPHVDFHKTVATVTSLAVLFSLVVGGIIWVVLSQSSVISERVTRHEQAIEKLSERQGWSALVSPTVKGR